MIRIVWIAAMVVLAAITIGAEIDRQSRFTPEIAGAAPAPLRGFALEALSSRAMAQGNAESAYTYSRELLAVRPLPAEHLSLFARASFLTGRQEQGLAALHESAQRGWRDPLAQMGMVDAALAERNYQVAADRLSALWAIGAGDEQFAALNRALLSRPEGREAFADVLAREGYWQASFTRRAVGMAEPQAVADTILRAQAKGAGLSCSDLQQAARRLEREDLDDLASQILAEGCEGNS